MTYLWKEVHPQWASLTEGLTPSMKLIMKYELNVSDPSINTLVRKTCMLYYSLKWGEIRMKPETKNFPDVLYLKIIGYKLTINLSVTY